MEAFLSTLPPYVHKFLDKHPATDVFNLLRELICFAVLYSEDRERIKAATDEFLVKREKEIKQEVEEQVIQEEEEEEEEEEETVAVVEEPKQIVADAVVPEIPVTEKPKMPNTFPQWWGHQEFQHPDRNVAAEKKVTAEKKITAEPITRTSTLWVSFDEEKEKPVKRLSSQVVIPNLRSYDEPTPKNQPMKEAKQQEGSPKPQRAPSVMKSPKQNATVRARAEHAKQLQQEMLKKKTTSESSPTSQRLKQRASSGIDWDTIKRERRKTVIPETQK